MTSEDFGFMLQQVPGAYGWIRAMAKMASAAPACTIRATTSTTTTSPAAHAFGHTLARRWLEQSSA